MDKYEAGQLVRDTLQNPFDRNRFHYFIKNLLNRFDEEATFVYRGNYIPDAYKFYIDTLERVGKYEDPEGNKIDILIVRLNKESSLEYARTMQRNFVAWYLNGSRGGELKDAALVAFVSPNPEDWRFSLVKMEYKLAETPSGKVKAKEELTPAKRLSFLVGLYENSHTAQSRLAPVIKDDVNNPTLKQLEEAFNIEKVTKEFFEKYRELFLSVKEKLEEFVKKDSAIKADFEQKQVNTVDFAKKLLGQIVFLYFLQKKGWFGVERDNVWGSGYKDFLRRLYEKNIVDYDNYFNDILEPLFYEALAKERDDNFYSRFNCKIPFLNGGLFDPISNYDWIHTDICLPNDLFSNSFKTKEGDVGTGILDVFDRYNFTVKEDEPLEKEVAVDPEMLGKVFENLLEVKDRKSKGTYYTPREIVHYMCQESLINHLVTECEGKANREDIETLIKLGETAIEHDSRVGRNGKETVTYSYKLPESIRKNAELIDEKLATIRVCDPAIGSGAFPVGMMNEIIRTRNALTSYIKDKTGRSIYDFKRHAIQNCLYGVDIDPGAVEIAKLRLWLSLVVDEEDIKQIKPLPNLDYKIMQGNSLLEEYEGIKLFDEGIVSASPLDNTKQIEEVKQKLNDLQREFIKLYSAGELKGTKKQQIELELKKQNDFLNKLTKTNNIKSENDSLFDQFSQAKKKADELKSLHKMFFEIAQKNEKDEIKKQIEALEWELIEASLREQGKLSLLPEIEHFKKVNIKPFFLWKLNFSEVFEENDGFDVVVGNPPYARIQGINKNLVSQYKKVYTSATGKFDLYVLFVERGLTLINQEGVLNFIMPHKWINSSFGEGLRTLTRNKLFKFISFKDYRVFNASAYTSLAWFKKQSEATKYIGLSKDLINNTELEEFLNSIKTSEYITINSEKLNNSAWAFADKDTQSVLEKINKQPLKVSDQFDNIFMGIVSGFDEAFYLDGEIKESYLHLKDGSKIEIEILKPAIKSKGFKRYEQIQNHIFIIYPHYLDNKSKTKTFSEDELKTKYPHAYKHLLKYKDVLYKKKIKYGTNTDTWFSLHNSREITYFEQSKIITPYLSRNSNMTLDEQGYYFSDANYGLIKSADNKIDYKFYLAIFNSKLFWFFIKNTGAVFGGGYYYFKSNYLRPFPLPDIKNEILIQTYISLVNRIIEQKKCNPQKSTTELERQIDQMVYKLYGLTQEEVKLVEENAK